jgi:hypothetical protein
VVTPECGVLYDEPTDGGLAAALDLFERRSFDPEALRRRSLDFSRDAFRDRVANALARAWTAFEARDGRPFAVDAVAGGPAAG